MDKRILLVLAFVFLASTSYADSSQAKKMKRADKNKDGVVDTKERHMEKQREQERFVSWQHSRAKVNTPLEAKYDANHDGWLETAEVKEMMKDKYALIKTDGKAKVDSPLEAEYDKNKDGIIDAQEAQLMAEDLK